MKKVLIINYYWPPSGGIAVQRWLKMSSYLPDYGWSPVVYVPENADYPLVEAGLSEKIDPRIKVISQPIWEVRNTFKKVSALFKKSKRVKADDIFFGDPKKRSFFQKVSLWVRGNFFIPDARVSWVRRSVNYLTKYIRENEIDVIISSGPPHSLHLIALHLKRKTGVKWISDFRDPWTEIEYYDKMLLTKYADKKHRRLEKAVLSESDIVVSVSPHWQKSHLRLGAKQAVVVTNGYDENDFPPYDNNVQKHFVLCHAGTMAGDRNPRYLWQVLDEIIGENEDFKRDFRLEILGRISSEVVNEIKNAGLQDHIINRGFVPHSEAIKSMQSASVLLIIINDASFNAPGRMTGKIFEYMAAKRPILLIGPKDSDPADILREDETGVSVNFEDKPQLEKVLLELYDHYKKDGLIVNNDNYKKYSRRAKAKEYSVLLNNLAIEQN